jgi:hypothetical protein
VNAKSVFYVIFSIIGLYLFGQFLARDTGQPNVEFLPEMVYSPAYSAFAENPNFSDGKTLQLPPEGSIPLGFLPEYPDGELTAENAGEVLHSPLINEEIDRNRGAFIYATFCQICHGFNGDGDGPVTKRGVPPPPSLKTEKVRKMRDGDLYFLISRGVGNMPGYDIQIKRSDRWQVVEFLKTLN